MLKGQAVELFPKGRNVVARWAVKTAMTRDVSDPPERRLIHPSLLRELCQRHGRPSSLTLVFLGWYLGESRVLQYGRFLTPTIRVGMNVNPRGFTSTFSVGQVVFQVVRLNEEPDRAAAMRTGQEVGLVHIWPTSEHGVVWPPPTYLTDDTLKRL